MGGGTWSSTAYSDRSTVRARSLGHLSYATATADEVFESRQLNAELDLNNFTVREARDNAEHPESTPIIIGLDVTGSMGPILQQMATRDINELMKAIYDRRPITDPQVLCLGIGDNEFDSAPLQATQFESDIRIADQLEKLWLEGGGGGNSYEGYALAWWFARNRTATDAWDKRQKKGYVFTVGDEFPTPHLNPRTMRAKFGGFGLPERDHGRIDAATCLTDALTQWEVFHVATMQGSQARRMPEETIARWTEVLGQRVIRLNDHTKLAEVVVSAIQMAEGMEYDDVVSSWSGDATVAEALRGIRLRT